MYCKVPETNTLALTEKKPHRFLNLFSCRFHTLAYWLTFNKEILTLLSHDKHTNDYNFMIDFMYILAPPSPLNKVHLKGSWCELCKIYVLFKICSCVLNITDSKKRKKNDCQCNNECFFSQIRLPFFLSMFFKPS